MSYIKRIVKKILGINHPQPTDPFKALEEKGLVIAESTKPKCHSIGGIDGLYPWLIEIGDHCIISSNVRILAHDASTKYLTGYTKLGRVSIGHDVFIGHGSTILCGVTVGDNVIIGANSLVNKSLNSNGVYVGNPVRYVCSIEEYKNRYLEEQKNAPKYEKDWKYWSGSEPTMEEKIRMKEELKDTFGYVR